MNKKPSIMLVPPEGRIKNMRLSLWLAVVLVIMVGVGLAGYFVPVDRLILTTQELEYKKNLEEQNDRLHQNIGATLKMLSGLKEHTASLEAKKVRANEVIGLPQAAPQPVKQGKQVSATASAAASAELLRRVEEQEKFISGFAATVAKAGGGERNLFDTIPVLHPVSGFHSVVTRQFGMSRDPFTSKQKMHYGTDFAAVDGAPVVTSASGTVTLVENDAEWGRRVTVAHGRGLRTVYAHLGSVRVAQGRQVKRGDEIGTVGVTGLTTGPHVHYELWRGNEPLNPEDYLFPAAVVKTN
jgi:murein DD-endopeptidase MepM/ murein hydrolase activator NlpD